MSASKRRGVCSCGRKLPARVMGPEEMKPKKLVNRQKCTALCGTGHISRYTSTAQPMACRVKKLMPSGSTSEKRCAEAERPKASSACSAPCAIGSPARAAPSAFRPTSRPRFSPTASHSLRLRALPAARAIQRTAA